ncbi:hypothetical protein DFP72DRAFT_1102562 [Ephemerocybe angulata]|uniref:Uncharacterized protein n=1 Tax=Ephemerocybe angulata TaxID=980116 RepID=A0A8H6MCQ1_9AGAR|nr:hypothetical protein DFP72DRAFT_1102562 [Tulosesus angulatus]
MQGVNHFVNLAFRDAIQMHANGKRTWVTDLETALRRLPLFPVILDITELGSVAGIDSLIDKVQKSCAQFLHQSLNTERLPLLKPDIRPMVSTSFQTVLCLRKYLRTVRVPAHRRALLSLLCADHSLGVEQLRRRRYPDKSRIPRECRICRYCGAPTETEIHALFRCEGPEESNMITDRRLKFMERVEQIAIGAVGADLVARCTSDTDESTIIAIHFFLEHDDLAPVFAKYVYDVLKTFPISL